MIWIWLENELNKKEIVYEYVWICELYIDWKMVWIESKYDYMWLSEICIGIELFID